MSDMDDSILVWKLVAASARIAFHITTIRCFDTPSTKFLRYICSCASSFDVVATHFRIHHLTFHTSWTLSNSENQFFMVASNFFKACLNHSSSFEPKRSCGIEEDEEERSTNGLYDLRLGGRRRKCVEDGRVVRRVCVVSSSSAGSSWTTAVLLEVSDWIYSKTPEIIE